MNGDKTLDHESIDSGIDERYPLDSTIYLLL